MFEATSIKGKLLPPHYPDSSNAVVTILAKDKHTGKGILAKLVQTLHHPRYKVGGHKEKGEFVVVVVICLPKTPPLRVKVFPEVGNGLGFCILIGVDSLESIQVE